MNISASSEFAATSAVAVTYSFFPEPWDIVLEFQRVETAAVGGSGRQLHAGPMSWTGLVVAPRYRFSLFSGPILKRVTPLVGAGIGYYLMDHSLSGRGQTALRVDCDQLTGTACGAPEEKVNSTVGVHAEAGLDLALFWGWSFSVEGRWLSMTPDVITTTTFPIAQADLPTPGRSTVLIRRAAQYFVVLSTLLRYTF